MKKIIIGNWKMNKTLTEAKKFVEKIIKKKLSSKKEIVICPSFTNMSPFATALGKIKLGAQNVAVSANGCLTGEVSAEMLRSLNCKYVIVGHSERREKLGELDSDISAKISQINEYGMTTILCIGETLEEREGKLTSKKLSRQLKGSLKRLKDLQGQLIVAYEPIWAISDGNSAKRTPLLAEIEKECDFVRKKLISFYGAQKVEKFCRVLYGGSVNSKNCKIILSSKSIDGVLVGGASLDVDEFVDMINL